MRGGFRSALIIALLTAGCSGGGPECDTQECFAERIAACEPASYTVFEAGAEGRYEIIDPVEEACRVEFTYVRNPNPELAGASMTFAIASASELEGAVTECLAGSGERYLSLIHI